VTWGFAWWIRFDKDDTFWKPHITDTWAANVVGTAISVAIVYRTSMAWARYWEAANQVQFMFSKWSDSFSQLMSFISTAEKRMEKAAEETPEMAQRKKDLQRARRRLAHDFSLLSALGTHRLTHGDLGRMRRRSEKFSEGSCCGGILFSVCRLVSHWTDLIVYKQDLRYNDVTNAFKLPPFKVVDLQSRKTHVKARVQKNPTSAAPLHFLAAATSFDKGGVKRHTSVSEQTLDTLNGDESRTSTNSVVLLASNVTWSSDLVILGCLSLDERSELNFGLDPDDKRCTQPDRVSLLVGWISEDINELVPIADTPPPIMSRCYQELSNGMLGFNQATKMADIPFPFPFSQLLELLLVCFTCMIPVYAAHFTGGLISSPFLAAVVTVAFWSLSEISRELETPFADGPNQLPVIDMHERFVEVVRTMFLTRRPEHISRTTPPSEVEVDAEDQDAQPAGEPASEEGGSTKRWSL